MSQFIPANINPATTSGTDLANLENLFKDAIASGFSGTARPTNLQKCGYWIDTSLEISQGIFRYYMFDGTGDLLVLSINKTTGRIVIPQIDSSQEIRKASADTLPAILDLHKLRAETGAGAQVLSADVISQLTSSSTDDTGAKISDAATIEAVATESHTGAAQGTELRLYIKLIGTAVKFLIASFGETINFFKDLNMNSKKITNLLAPTALLDAINKAYGDAFGGDLLLATSSTTALVSTDAKKITATGSGTIQLPSTATLTVGQPFYIDNKGSSSIPIQTLGGATTLVTLVRGQRFVVRVTSTATEAWSGVIIPILFGGALNVNSNKVINVTPGTANNDAVNLAQLNSNGLWQKFTVTHATLQAAALTNNTTLLTIPAKNIVEQVLIKTSTAFSGGAISAYSLTIGITGSESKYMTAYDAFAAVSGGNYNMAGNSVAGADLNASEAIKLFATSVGANLDQSTAGSVDIWVKTSVLV